VDSPEDETPTETFRDPGLARAARGADYGPPGETAPAEHRWRGADDWRNHWAQPDEEEAGGEGRRGNEGADSRVSRTGQDPAMAQTRLDYGYPGEPREDDSYRPDDGPDPGDSNGKGSLPATEAPGRHDDDPVPARMDGNGGGIPLSWDDE
jgi:hypothetical protein